MELDLVLLLKQSMLLATELALPILGTALIVGVLIGLLQAVTQVQEMTLTFVPKLVAVGVAVLFCGHWMLHTAVEFTQHILQSIAYLGN